MWQEISYTKVFEQLETELKKGAFLTVRDGDKENIMTIGWGFLGTMWTKPVFVAPIRHSRYSYKLVKNSGTFAVCIPNGDLYAQRGLCGSKSGRDVDKIKETGFTYSEGKKISAPIIEQCDIILECKVLAKDELGHKALDGQVDETFYGNKDYHNMFYGEIVACYKKN